MDSSVRAERSGRGPTRRLSFKYLTGEQGVPCVSEEVTAHSHRPRGSTKGVAHRVSIFVSASQAGTGPSIRLPVKTLTGEQGMGRWATLGINHAKT